MYGIVGYGTVGKATGTCFKTNRVKWWAYDTDEKAMASLAKDNVYYQEYMEHTSVVFVCVPTPAKTDVGYETYHLEKAVDWLVEQEFEGQAVIVSTIGTNTYSLLKYLVTRRKGKFSLIVCPEFLRSKHAVYDLHVPKGPLVYGPSIRDARKRDKLLTALNARHNYPRIYKAMSPEACSLIKTGTNLALAAKLITASVVYASGTNARLSSRERRYVLDAVFNDRRLRTPQNYHNVAMEGNDLGFGGQCLPKDVEAVSEDMTRPAFVREFARCLLHTNRWVRGNG